tara:strand:- start:145 stop:342 length:198 start_codon:yes stop_codon:yes gene_type:complete
MRIGLIFGGGLASALLSAGSHPVITEPNDPAIAEAPREDLIRQEMAFLRLIFDVIFFDVSDISIR